MTRGLSAAVLAATLVAGGCVNPTLDPGGYFTCSASQPACPPGEVCKNGRCVPAGSSPDARQDGPRPDGPTTPDLAPGEGRADGRPDAARDAPRPPDSKPDARADQPAPDKKPPAPDKKPPDKLPTPDMCRRRTCAP